MILSNAGLFLSVERRNTEVFISSSSIFMYPKHIEKEEERDIDLSQRVIKFNSNMLLEFPWLEFFIILYVYTKLP